MSKARENILARLRDTRVAPCPAPPPYAKTLGWDKAKRIEEFTARMQAVRGEVQRVSRSSWVDWLSRELVDRDLKRVLVGQGETANRFVAGAHQALPVSRYQVPIEDWKQSLFNDFDVAITGTVAGLAESGSLVLWPDRNEPRLMSLVPPMHVALLDSDRLFENFAELIAAENWSSGMPTNALLISGPSKTADIEQTLAYGIHGPKTLLTLILE